MTVSRLALVFLCLFAASASEARTHYERHVVTVEITFQGWDEDRPWAKTNPSTRAASAVVVEGPLLLTRAQMVADATLIQAERAGDARAWPARVVHTDPEIDLALIAVDDPEFFEGLRPAKLASKTPTSGSLSTVRWKDRQLEVAASRISTIEVRANRYGNVAHAFLVARTDLERGGWAEPVFDGSKLVGITASQDKQRASVVPSEILRAYLERAGAPAGYTGFARFDLLWQNNQDLSLNRYLELKGEPRGILIRGTRRGGSACGVLQSRDILLELDGHEIDAIGNYQHPRYGRVRFTQIAVENHRPGDRITATVFRDGREQELEIGLKAYPSELRMIPWRRENRAPTYLIAGGLVFRELDGPFLRTWGTEWSQRAPSDLVIRYHLGAHSQTPEKRRVLVLSSVLPDRYNLGYHDLANMAITHVNGQSVDSMRALQQAFAAPELDAQGEPAFHVIRLAPNSFLAEIVLDAGAFAEANERILAAYGVPQAMRFGDPADRAGDIGPPCEETP